MQGNLKCPEGHSICESCHSGDSKTLISEVAFTTSLKNPVDIAELMMSLPNLPPHGCEHALIGAGALMAALKNSPYGNGKITNADITEVLSRTEKQAVSGYCGLTGVCGVAPAIGACFSLFLGAHCGSDREQKITMEAVIEVSRAIADITGPSCCKAYVRSAISVAVTIFTERLCIALSDGESPVICKDGDRQHGCREEKCPYFRKTDKDPFAIHLPVMACQS